MPDTFRASIANSVCLWKRGRFIVSSTNENFAKWAQIFGDAKMTTALMYGLKHRCHIVETGDHSCWFQQLSTRSKIAAAVAHLAKIAPHGEVCATNKEETSNDQKPCDPRC